MVAILRLGMTETTLLLMLMSGHENECKMFNSMVNWMYTCGFYDKTISGSNHDFNSDICYQSPIYKEYFQRIIKLLPKLSRLILLPHKFDTEQKIHEYCDSLRNFCIVENLYRRINDYNESHYIGSPAKEEVFMLIKNKRLLIINPIASLMKNQYENGNCKRIYKDFPKIKSIDFYENVNTLGNSGPDNNIIETAEKCCNEIKLHINKYDILLISAGPYTSLFTGILIDYNVDIITFGGSIPSLFGIKSGRSNVNIYNEYWISIPQNFVPSNSYLAEKSTYW